MKLIQCRFSSGQRVPLLVQDGLVAPLPKLVPFIYVQLKLRHRAYNTASAHLRAIQAFYTYAKSRELDIDEAILACHFEAILALLDGYAIWLQSGRQADNLVARIGIAKMLLVAYPVLASNLMHSSKAITMNQHSQSASSLAEIMDGKQKRPDALMLAVSLASPFELEGPAQRLKEALQKPDIEHHRQRIPPPAFAR